MFKVGDKLESLRGPCVVVAIEAGRDCGVKLKYDDGTLLWVTSDGRLYPHYPHPFVWFPETGHGPEVGERPVEYPLVMKSKKSGAIIEFTGRTSGTVLFNGNGGYDMGHFEDEWVPHTDARVWEPCERPKWKPEKPTWCWVWNEFEEDRIIRLVSACNICDDYLGAMRNEDGSLSRAKAHWINAEPCAPEDIPEWWPEEWK